jgi:hypothetical protein
MTSLCGESWSFAFFPVPPLSSSSKLTSEWWLSYLLRLKEAALLDSVVIDQAFLLPFELPGCLFGLSLKKGQGVLGLLSLILDLLPG